MKLPILILTLLATVAGCCGQKIAQDKGANQRQKNINLIEVALKGEVVAGGLTVRFDKWGADCGVWRGNAETGNRKTNPVKQAATRNSSCPLRFKNTI